MRRPGERAIWVALAAAAALHLVLFAVVRLAPRAALPAAQTPATSELNIELEGYPELAAATAGATPEPLQAPPASAEPPRTEPPSAAPRSSEPARAEPAPPSALLARLERSAKPEPPSAAVSAAELETPQASPPAAPVTPERSLSLSELGIGTLSPAVVAGAATGSAAGSPAAAAAPGAVRDAQGPASAQAVAQARLDHSLRAGIAEHDQKLGLGPEAPVVLALERLTYEGSTAPNGEASIVVRVGADGKITSAELIGASGDGAAWERIVQSLLRELSQRRLRVPARGATLELKVVSREQLPSGASPGLAVDIAGIPIKRGRGPRPTRLSLLTPLMIHVPLPGDPDAITLPMIGLGFAFMGDPVDIGARARRVVHARLTKLQVH